MELLRESCLSGYVGIVQAFHSSADGLVIIEPYVASMVQLISFVAESNPPSSESLCATACGLVGDLVNAYGAPILQVIDVDPIAQLVNRCSQSSHSKAKALSAWATREINRAKRPVGAIQY